MATHSNILAWRIPMDRRPWQATIHGVAKSQTDMTKPNMIPFYIKDLSICRFEYLRSSWSQSPTDNNRQLHCFKNPEQLLCAMFYC